MMNSQQIKQMLGSGTASLLCFALACVGRMAYLLSEFKILTDKSYQLHAAKNLWEGKGITVLQSSWSDLSIAEFVPLIKWPPLYSILTAPFFSFGSERFYLGAVVIDLLTCVFFVWIARKLFEQLGKTRWEVNVFTLIIGFFMYHFARGWSTDLMSASFLMAATYLAIGLSSGKRSTVLKIVAIVSLLWLAGLSRYLSIPLAFIPPLFLWMRGRMNRDYSLTRKGLQIGAGITVLFAIQFLVSSNTGGTPVYLYPFDREFSPENLLRTGPFIFAAAGNLEPALIKGSQWLGLPFEKVQQGIIIIHLVVLLAMMLILFHPIRKKRTLQPALWFAVSFSLATLVILVVLSLTYAAAGNGWTYVSELRYYAVAIMFIQICLFNYAINTKGILPKILLIVMIASAIHGFAFTARQLFRGEFDIGKKTDLLELDRGLFLAGRQKEASLLPVVCISNEPVFTNVAALRLEIPGVTNTNFHRGAPGTSKEMNVFIAIRKDFGTELIRQLGLSANELLDETANWLFYLKAIKPGPQP